MIERKLHLAQANFLLEIGRLLRESLRKHRDMFRLSNSVESEEGEALKTEVPRKISNGASYRRDAV